MASWKNHEVYCINNAEREINTPRKAVAFLLVSFRCKWGKSYLTEWPWIHSMLLCNAYWHLETTVGFQRLIQEVWRNKGSSSDFYVCNSTCYYAVLNLYCLIRTPLDRNTIENFSSRTCIVCIFCWPQSDLSIFLAKQRKGNCGILRITGLLD